MIGYFNIGLIAVGVILIVDQCHGSQSIFSDSAPKQEESFSVVTFSTPFSTDTFPFEQTKLLEGDWIELNPDPTIATKPEPVALRFNSRHQLIIGKIAWNPIEDTIDMRNQVWDTSTFRELSFISAEHGNGVLVRRLVQNNDGKSISIYDADFSKFLKALESDLLTGKRVDVVNGQQLNIELDKKFFNYMMTNKISELFEKQAKVVYAPYPTSRELNRLRSGTAKETGGRKTGQENRAGPIKQERKTGDRPASASDGDR